jgi:hypothetical protein
VLGVADHVHAEDAGTVEPLDDSLGGNTDRRDEELSTALDDDIDELVELALGVVVAVGKSELISLVVFGVFAISSVSYLVLRALPPTWGRSRSTPKGAFLSFR